MLKKWVSRLLIFVFMVCPLQAWAETNQASIPLSTYTSPEGLQAAHTEAYSQTLTETISLPENPWLAEINQKEQYVPRGLGGIQILPGMWLLSVPISGLGQLVMGDPIRGLLFFMASPLFLLLVLYLPGMFTQPNYYGRYALQSDNFSTKAFAPTFGYEFLLGALAVIGVWIWNIVDAIQMNERLLTAPPEQAEQITQELEAKLQAYMNLVENNQLQVGATGPTLSHRFVNF